MGLSTVNEAVIKLRGSYFTGDEGDFNYGIFADTSQLEAVDITALAQNGTDVNYGTYVDGTVTYITVTHSILEGADNAI